MNTFTPKYGIIDYKQYDDLLPSKPFLGIGVCTYAKEQEIKAYEIKMKNMADKEGIWFINVYDIIDPLKTFYENTQQYVYPECKTRYFIDNYLNLWSQRFESSPNVYAHIDLRNTRSMVTKNSVPVCLDKPVSDDIIQKIKHEWVLPNDITRINVIREYVKMYNEIKKLSEPPMPLPKKPIDDEIAELQERIMKLYAEKNKN